MREAVLDTWFARAIEVYPAETLRFLATEQDRFRNPVGTALRENLALLLGELMDGIDPFATRQALGAVMRIRAVQGLTPSQAVGFVLALRQILGGMGQGGVPCDIDARIDQMALMAFEEYLYCRERVFEVRVSESRRAMAVPAAMALAGGAGG